LRAIVFDGQTPRFDANRPDPKPGPGEALIRPLLAGICSTDLEICRGYMQFTGVLGHEFVGIVEALGDHATPRAQSLLGKRVVGTINCVCGQCDMCRRGLSNHCRQRTVLGIAGRDGCFADRFVLPAVNLLPVPDSLDNDHAVFTEPLAAACAIPQQLHVEGKPLVTVLGDGRLGLLVAQVLARLNATVRVIGKHPQKLACCEKWGIKHRLVSETTPRADQDIVVDCTGSSTGLELATAMVRPRGKLVLKTTVADARPINLAPIVIHEITVIGSRCGPFPDALDLLASQAVDVVSLISRRVKLSQGVEALRLASQGDTIKVLIDFA
jgi:threonine dehydrogenase-like Zn-dependent dehydrogenase